MSKPSPKANFIQTLLFMCVIFLGLQLIFRPSPTPKDLNTSDKVLAKMRDYNARGLDQTMVREQLLSTLKRTVSQEVEKRTLTAEEGKRRTFEGTILQADTQYKAGKTLLAQNDKGGIGRIHQAYLTIHGIEKGNLATPMWNSTEFAVPPRKAEGLTYSRVTPAAMYTKIVGDLSAAYKDDMILGFLPGYKMIDSLVAMTGRVPGFSYAFAAFLLALFVRALIYPLAQKQLMWGRQMSQLSPRIKEIQEQFKDKPQEMQRRVMETYQRYGINPLSGCAPLLLQMPLFLLIYQCMLHYQFEFQKGTFLWINPSTSAATSGWIAPNLGQLDYILIVLYGISMVISTLLTPVSDPTQAKQQRLIGVGFSIFFTVTMFFGWFPVPAGFVLYWTFTNMLATAQSLRAYRLPMPPLQEVNSKPGGIFALDPNAGKPGPSTNGAAPTKTGRPVTHKPKKRK